MDAWVGQTIVAVAVLVIVGASIRLWARTLNDPRRRRRLRRRHRGAPYPNWRGSYGAGVGFWGGGGSGGDGGGGGCDSGGGGFGGGGFGGGGGDGGGGGGCD